MLTNDDTIYIIMYPLPHMSINLSNDCSICKIISKKCFGPYILIITHYPHKQSNKCYVHLIYML